MPRPLLPCFTASFFSTFYFSYSRTMRGFRRRFPPYSGSAPVPFDGWSVSPSIHLPPSCLGAGVFRMRSVFVRGCNVGVFAQFFSVSAPRKQLLDVALSTICPPRNRFPFFFGCFKPSSPRSRQAVGGTPKMVVWALPRINLHESSGALLDCYNILCPAHPFVPFPLVLGSLRFFLSRDVVMSPLTFLFFPFLALWLSQF